MVRRVSVAIALATAVVSARAVGQTSDNAPPPPVVEPFHPFQIRLKLGGVIPTNGHASIYDGGLVNAFGAPQSILQATGYSFGAGTSFRGAGTEVSPSIAPLLDLSYFFTKNWSVEAICCVSPHHVTGTGVLQGASLIETWVFPPSLLLQYHVTNFGPVQPYLGVGVNYTAYWSRPGAQTFPLGAPALPGVTAFTGAYSASITPSWGVVAQAGVDYMFNDFWGVNVDVKYVMMEPKAHVWTAAVASPGNIGPLYAPLNLNVPINPLVVSAGLTYRFGANWDVPKILPF
jgi:outer membrane protein